MAAYARVSTDSDEQLTSYEAQVDYYTKFIQSREDWEFVTVYTDEGISAVTTKKRDGFNQMVADALEGDIDLIVTKSVSRFARNTVDSLTTVRKLKEKGVEVWFEKENIYTLDSKGEDGLPQIVPAEAKIVRLIFRLYMEGKTFSAIAKHLERHNIPSPAGKKTWQTAVVQSILTNEKYKGHALLQKTFCADFLTKKMVKNEGQVQQYYVENSHPAIIEPDEFDAVQLEIERRKNLGRPTSSTSIFASRLICADCGGRFGKKVWGSYKGDKTYRKEVWQCNDKYKRLGNPGKGCQTPHITEEVIKERFLAAFNQLMHNRDELIEDCRLAQNVLCDTTAIDTELAELFREIEVVTELSRKAIYENARSAVDQKEWTERNNAYLERHHKASKQVDELEAIKRERLGKGKIIEGFIKDIESRPLAIAEFDEKLWLAVIDQVTVNQDGAMTFRFKNGSEVTA